MVLKVSSSVKGGDQELIPACKENVNLKFESEELENFDIVDSYHTNTLIKVTNVIAWSQKLTIRCRTVFSNYWTFDFRSGRAMVQKKKRRYLEWKSKNSKPRFYYGLRYLSNVSGFSLLSVKKSGELRVHYYDFEEKFSTDIKIRIPSYDSKDYDPKYIKLCSRSIWILRYTLGMVFFYWYY